MNKKKVSIVLAMVILLVHVALAYTVPNDLPLEIRHYNRTNGMALSGTYVMNFSIYDDSSRSNLICMENQSVTFDSNGIAGIYITCTDDFNQDTYLCIDDTGDDDEQTTCIELGFVPYSKYSNIAQDVVNTTYLVNNTYAINNLLNNTYASITYVNWTTALETFLNWTTSVNTYINYTYALDNVVNYSTESCIALTGDAGLCDGSDDGGGGSGGTVDIYNITTSCTDGQIAKNQTGRWVCADDDDTTYTGGDAITITAGDIDFDGGATPGGELGGTWASPTVDDTALDDQYATLEAFGEAVSNITLLNATVETIIVNIDDIVSNLTNINDSVAKWDESYSWGDWSSSISTINTQIDEIVDNLTNINNSVSKWDEAYSWGDWSTIVNSIVDNLTNINGSVSKWDGYELSINNIYDNLTLINGSIALWDLTATNDPLDYDQESDLTSLLDDNYAPLTHYHIDSYVNWTWIVDNMLNWSVAPTCGAGDFWTFDGTDWTCDTPAGGGDITAVLSDINGGLDYTTNTTSGSATMRLRIDCGENQILKNQSGGWICASDDSAGVGDDIYLNITANQDNITYLLNNATEQDGLISSLSSSIDNIVTNLTLINGSIVNWDTAYSWGDWSTAVDNIVTNLTLINGSVSSWDEAVSWGNHADANYLDLDTYPNADTDSLDDVNTTTEFGGDITGTYNAIAVTDDSHNHVIANIDEIVAGVGSEDMEAAEDFGDFTCDGTDGGCSIDAGAVDDTVASDDLTISSGTNKDLLVGDGYACISDGGTCNVAGIDDGDLGIEGDLFNMTASVGCKQNGPHYFECWNETAGWEEWVN